MVVQKLHFSPAELKKRLRAMGEYQRRRLSSRSARKSSRTSFSQRSHLRSQSPSSDSGVEMSNELPHNRVVDEMTSVNEASGIELLSVSLREGRMASDDETSSSQHADGEACRQSKTRRVGAGKENSSTNWLRSVITQFGVSDQHSDLSTVSTLPSRSTNAEESNRVRCRKENSSADMPGPVNTLAEVSDQHCGMSASATRPSQATNAEKEHRPSHNSQRVSVTNTTSTQADREQSQTPPDKLPVVEKNPQNVYRPVTAEDAVHSHTSVTCIELSDREEPSDGTSGNSTVPAEPHNRSSAVQDFNFVSIFNWLLFH